jgi:hypothetical protein
LILSRPVQIDSPTISPHSAELHDLRNALGRDTEHFSVAADGSGLSLLLCQLFSPVTTLLSVQAGKIWANPFA